MNTMTAPRTTSTDVMRAESVGVSGLDSVESNGAEAAVVVTPQICDDYVK